MTMENDWTSYSAAAYDFKVSRSTLRRAVTAGRIRIHRQSARSILLWQPDIEAMVSIPVSPMNQRDTTERLHDSIKPPIVETVSNRQTEKFLAWKAACGFTTNEAAEQLGFSAQHILHVEKGWQPVTEELARCCQAVSGVSPISMMEDDGELETLKGKPFDRKTFLLWPTQGERFAALGGARHAINRQRF